MRELAKEERTQVFLVLPLLRISRASASASSNVVMLSIELALVDLRSTAPSAGPGVAPSSSRWRPLTSGSGGACSTPSSRARVTNQSIAEQSKPPPRPSQSARATRASSSRSTFCASRRNAAVPDGRLRLVEHARLEVVRDDAEHLAPDVVPLQRMDVQPIEQRRGGRDALPPRDRASGSVRR